MKQQDNGLRAASGFRCVLRDLKSAGRKGMKLG